MMNGELQVNQPPEIDMVKIVMHDCEAVVW